MTKSEQLAELKKACDLILEKSPKRRCLDAASFMLAFWNGEMTTYIGNIDKSLRDGVVFYSRGWGWRLRKDWKTTLDSRIKEQESQQ